MKIKTLVDAMKTTEIPCNEALSPDESVYPRIIYWESYWDDVVASGTDLTTISTYTIWFFSKIPRNPKLIELKKTINDLGFFPSWTHERTEDGTFQSYCQVEIDSEF